MAQPSLGKNQSNQSTVSTAMLPMQPVHIPVLLEEVLRYLDPRPGESYLDLTAGYGGHAKAVLQRTQASPMPRTPSSDEGAGGGGGMLPGKAVLVDRDSNAVRELRKAFVGGPVEILHMDFLQASRRLHAGGRQFDMILADLGVSSPHLNEGTRGFAIAADGPLDMRMDQSQTLTAATIVNDYPAEQIADILKRYGEEPKARAIAQAIVQHRPLTTTTELAAVVARVWSGRNVGRSKVHPATRTFQALRIAVNDELRQIEQSLPLWIDMLAPGGRLVVISFHSLEDRLVKQAFHEAGGSRSGSYDDYDATLTVLTKRPVMASESEVVFNPRARSAKLRAAVKSKNG